MPNSILSIILPQVLDSMYIKLYTFIILPPIQDSIYAKLYTFYNPASCSGQYVFIKIVFIFSFGALYKDDYKHAKIFHLGET